MYDTVRIVACVYVCVYVCVWCVQSCVWWQSLSRLQAPLRQSPRAIFFKKKTGRWNETWCQRMQGQCDYAGADLPASKE